MLIKDLPEDERPREKLISKGAESLSDSEILALFFGTGRQGISAIELGREMLKKFDSMRNMSRASFEELLSIDGIGPAKAAQLAAIFEFGKRLAKEPFNDQAITTPEEVYELVGTEMQRLTQESVRTILLNSQKRLIQVAEIFVGTGNQSFANPPEILRKVISHSAASFILVHNHPSGDPSPSRADHDVTRRMKDASDAIGVEFLDHIIIGGHSVSENRSPYFSFREAGLL
ncbi:DNA repair protein RadC [Verrucomicrobiales bacterium BCK34]|nr:DNA repair protein RadC [Verrucomicrobiales bacterium BCK34]